MAEPCAKLLYTFDNSTQGLLDAFPDCADYVSGQDLGRFALVRANMEGGPGGPASIGAALSVGFGMSLFVALIVHAIGVEVYVSWSLVFFLRHFRCGRGDS